MSIFNRAFVALLALLWCVGIGAGIYLIWEQGRNLAIDGDWLQLDFDLIFETQAERILATIVAGALALPALLLLAMEMVPQGSGYSRADRRRAESYGGLEARVNDLQKSLDEERGRRRDAEKAIDRERGFAHDEARRNADAVRENNGSRVVTNTEKRVEHEPVRGDGHEPRRRGWRLLPSRRS
jgi:hypothetical protein